MALFLSGKISFLQIGELVSGALESLSVFPLNSPEDVYSAVGAAREYVAERFAKGL